jgi:hypothetical protein
MIFNDNTVGVRFSNRSFYLLIQKKLYPLSDDAVLDATPYEGVVTGKVDRIYTSREALQKDMEATTNG